MLYFSTLAALAAVAITSVQAVDIRFFQSNNCSGAFAACTNISAGQCCNNNGRTYVSQSLANIGRATTQQGFELVSCSSNGAGSSVQANICHRTPFTGRSARWFASGSRVIPTNEISTDPSNCAAADTFGFVEADGKIIEGKIPAGKEYLVNELVERGDVEGLKDLL